MNKPYIKLDQDFPGITSLFMFDPEVAKDLMSLGQTIMRRSDRGLSVGEREIIAAWVSKLNECNFCHLSHKECAKSFIFPLTVGGFFDDQNSENLSTRMNMLLNVATCIQSLNKSLLPHLIEQAQANGVSDEEIHDAVLIASFFSMCNRYVDGLGTTFKTGEPEEGGRSLAKYGYTMVLKCFFQEVLPKMWAKFWR